MFWDAGYGSVKKANELGWNVVLSGCRMKSGFSATGDYQVRTIAAANTNDQSLVGSVALTYWASSTFNKANTKTTDGVVEYTNFQFFGMMTTYTGQYKDGRLSMSFVHSETGSQLRCVKNK